MLIRDLQEQVVHANEVNQDLEKARNDLLQERDRLLQEEESLTVAAERVGEQ